MNNKSNKDTQNWEDRFYKLFGIVKKNHLDSIGEDILNDIKSFISTLITQAREEERIHLLKANDLLRSAYQIAKRENEKGCNKTNWKAFLKNCEKELDREHTLLLEVNAYGKTLTTLREDLVKEMGKCKASRDEQMSYKLGHNAMYDKALKAIDKVFKGIISNK